MSCCFSHCVFHFRSTERKRVWSRLSSRRRSLSSQLMTVNFSPLLPTFRPLWLLGSKNAQSSEETNKISFFIIQFEYCNSPPRLCINSRARSRSSATLGRCVCCLRMCRVCVCCVLSSYLLKVFFTLSAVSRTDGFACQHSCIMLAIIDSSSSDSHRCGIDGRMPFVHTASCMSWKLGSEGTTLE